MTRADGRTAEQIRPIHLVPGFLPYAEGSVLIELGRTRVVCAASVEETVPPFLRGSGTGWVTAEYRMLPRATQVRTPRDPLGRPDGRSVEIQRLIGRALRAAVERPRLGERTIVVDCDVLTADGGTRTAAITGGFVAIALAALTLLEANRISAPPLVRQIAAISAGIVGGRPLLDLTYAEDSIADVDANLVMSERDEIVELQVSAERSLPTLSQVEEIRQLAQHGIHEALAAQNQVLEAVAPSWRPRLIAPLAESSSPSGS